MVGKDPHTEGNGRIDCDMSRDYDRLQNRRHEVSLKIIGAIAYDINVIPLHHSNSLALHLNPMFWYT